MNLVKVNKREEQCAHNLLYLVFLENKVAFGELREIRAFEIRKQ